MVSASKDIYTKATKGMATLCGQFGVYNRIFVVKKKMKKKLESSYRLASYNPNTA